MNLSLGSKQRIDRIKVLKNKPNMSDEEVIELALSVTWLVYERRAFQGRIAVSTKPDNNDPNNKAPRTGSNSSSRNDDKATSDGKDVNPNRPKSD